MADSIYEGINKHQDACTQRIEMAEKEIESLQRMKLKVRNLRKTCFPDYYVYDDHFLNKPISMYRLKEVKDYISEVETRINKWEEILLEQKLQKIEHELSEQILGTDDEINEYEDQYITGSHLKDNGDYEPTEQVEFVTSNDSIHQQKYPAALTPDSCYYSESGDSTDKHSVQFPMQYSVPYPMYLFPIPPNQMFYILVNADCNTYHNNAQ